MPAETVNMSLLDICNSLQQYSSEKLVWDFDNAVSQIQQLESGASGMIDVGSHK